MYAGKLVFAQVMEFAPWHTFRRLVSDGRAFDMPAGFSELLKARLARKLGG